MRIACLQLNSIIGKLQQNISNANKIVETCLLKLDKPFDFLILPELALTGYNFPSRAAIEPYLEVKAKGPTSKWAIEMSQKHKCFTLVGYPEWDETDQKIFNSAILTAPDGSILYNYRKTFLYESDENWGCSESTNPIQFEPFELVLNKGFYLDNEPKLKLIICNIGICMDLNPYKFEAPFGKFEFLLSCYQNMSRLILCPMAWLSPKSPSIQEDKSIVVPEQVQEVEIKYDTDLKQAGEETKVNQGLWPDMSTVNYWILRFLPFLNHPGVDLPRYYNKVSLVCCNRSGQEGDVLYGGSTLIYQFKNVADPPSLETGIKNNSVEYYGSLGTAEQGIIVRDLDLE